MSSAARHLTPVPPLPLAGLDEHRVILRLGQGGMAEVFLATRPAPRGRELVVIKRLHGSDDDEPALERMFRDEARIALRLDHPNIVRTFGLGTLSGRHAIVMEFLEGQPLQKVLRRLAEQGRHLPIEVFVPLFADVLDGLHYAHESKDDNGRSLSVIHRDVSPHNLFLTSAGVLKLLDFGIAKTNLQEDRTRTGLLKGKVAYMAPEQARGETVDRRADIWSLGVVLWETLSGTRLFKADNEAASLRLTLLGDVRKPSSVRPELPADLDLIVGRALDRDPKSRYPTAAAMAAALRGWCARRGLQHGSAARQLMSELFEAELADQRRRIAEFLENGDAQPASGTLAVGVRPVALEAAAGTHVSTVSEFADELRRHERRRTRTLWLALAPVALSVLVLGYLVLARAPAATPSMAAPMTVPQLTDNPPPGADTAPIAPGAAAAAAPDHAVELPAAASRRETAKSAVDVAVDDESKQARLGSRRRRGDAPAERESIAVTTPTADFGYLTLDTSPWATVSVGGSSLGQTPVVRAKLPAGTHTLLLVNPERGISTTYQVTIAAGKTSVRRLGLD